MSRALLVEMLVLVGMVVPVTYFAATVTQEANEGGATKAEPRMNEEWKKDHGKKPLADQAVAMIADYCQKKLVPDLDLKVKSCSIVENQSGTGKRLRLLVEFTKDVDEKDWQRRFDSLPNVHVEISHFDEEDVRIGKSRIDFGPGETDGDVTFKKGQRFRIFLRLHDSINRDLEARTQRAELGLRVGGHNNYREVRKST